MIWHNFLNKTEKQKIHVFIIASSNANGAYTTLTEHQCKTNPVVSILQQLAKWLNIFDILVRTLKF